MKIVCKIMQIAFLITILCSSFQYVYASERVTSTGIKVASVTGDLGDLNEYKKTQTESSKLKSKVGVLLGWLQIIGTILSVIILTALGIKYMAGSVEEKAEYKKSLMPYIIGVAILFAGTFLPQLIYGIVKQIA